MNKSLNLIRNYKGTFWNYIILFFVGLPLGTCLLVGIGFGIKTISLSRVQHAANEAALTYARHCVKLRDNQLSKTTQGRLGSMGIEGGDNLNLAPDLAQIDFSYAGLESLYNAGSATVPIGQKAAVPGAMTLEYTEASQVLLYNLWGSKIPDASWVSDIRQNQCYVSADKSHFSLNKNAKPNTCMVNGYISKPFMSLKWLFMASKYGEGVCCTQNAKGCTQGGEYDFCVVVKVTGRLDPTLEGGIPFLQNLGIIKDGSFTIQARANVKNMVDRFSNGDAVSGDTVSLGKVYPQTCEFSCNHPPQLDPPSSEPIEALINTGEITPESLAKCVSAPEECIRIEPGPCKWKSSFPEEAYLQWNPDLIKVEKPDGSYLIQDPADNAMFLSAQSHYEERGKKQGRIAVAAIEGECDQGQSKCGASCLFSAHCAGAVDGCTICKDKICTSSDDKCGHLCADDNGCKGSLTCPNCLNNICTSDFCNKPCTFNSQCAPSVEAGCNECLDGRCAKPNCQWDVNNLVPAELEVNSGLKECDIKNLHGNYIDGAACSKDGDLCSAPWTEPPPAELFQNLTPNDLNSPAVKVFRCACTNPKNAANAFVWDFQRYAFTGETIPNCPPANSLPGNKVDNNSCEIEGALCKTVEDHIFGKKVFKCEKTSNTSGITECRWDLNTFTTMNLKPPNMPACIPDANNPEKYNNVACALTDEGKLCYKPEAEPFTLQQMKNGWRKRFQCDCSPTPPKRSCSWDVNGFAKADTLPTADLPFCTFPEGQQYIDGSECTNTGDGCLTEWTETPNTNGNCVSGFCDNFEGKTCSSSADCPATFPYLDGNENDANIKMVKLFRCSCGDDNQPSWDFQRFLDTTAPNDMVLPLCPDASNLPGQKVDNSPCDPAREDRCRTGDRIFRCEPPNAGCRLDLNNFTPADSPLPECPENAGTVNNVDCRSYGEGWRCKKTGAAEDQWTLEEFRAGWKKIFRCDCNETLNCTNYCN